MVDSSHIRKSSGVCKVCGRTRSGLVPAALIRPVILAEIQKNHPEFTAEDHICPEDLNRFRFQYVQDLMASERGELTALDHEVLESMHAHELLTSNIGAEFEKKATFGEALADKVADFGGSWRFILIFAGIIIIWVAINSLALSAWESKTIT